MDSLIVFFFGFLGAALNELLGIYNLRRRLSHFRSPLYFFISLFIAAAGGGTALMFFSSGAISRDFFIAFFIGIATPSIIRDLAKTGVSEPKERDRDIPRLQ